MLLKLIDDILVGVDKNFGVVVMIIDLSAVFDCVSHSTLESKLSIYGFSNNSNKFIQSYLTDRKQCVSVSGINSEFQKIDTGVPQGSIIGPFFYYLYT